MGERLSPYVSLCCIAMAVCLTRYQSPQRFAVTDEGLFELDFFIFWILNEKSNLMGTFICTKHGVWRWEYFASEKEKDEFHVHLAATLRSHKCLLHLHIHNLF